MIWYLNILCSDHHNKSSYCLSLYRVRKELFSVMRTFKISSLSSSQICSTVLVTAVITLCITSLQVSYFITGRWCHWTPFTHFTHPTLLPISPLIFGEIKSVPPSVAFLGSEPHTGVTVPSGSVFDHEIHRPHDRCHSLRGHAFCPAHHYQPVSAQCPAGVEFGRCQHAPHFAITSSEQVGNALPFQLHQ